MRFLAAFSVLFDHACQTNWSGPGVAVNPAWRTVLRLLVLPTHLGREAVVVFFVLSGALVGGLTLEKVHAGTFDVRAYAADRLARVYVPLLPALLLSVAVLRAHGLGVDPLSFAGCLFGLQGVAVPSPRINAVLWSLAYEVWFYVLAGSVAVAAGRRERPRTAWVSALAVAGGMLSLWVLCGRLEWINLACWLVGALGFGLRHRLAPGARGWMVAAGLTVMVLSVLGLWTDFLPPVGGVWIDARGPWRWPLAHLTLSAGALSCLVGACQHAPRTRIGAWIERLGTPLAAFSYTLYLTHYPLLLALSGHNDEMPEIVTWPSLLRLGEYLMVCLGGALFLYALFERQTPRVRRWLRTRLGGGVPSCPIPAPDPGDGQARKLR